MLCFVAFVAVYLQQLRTVLYSFELAFISAEQHVCLLHRASTVLAWELMLLAVHIGAAVAVVTHSSQPAPRLPPPHPRHQGTRRRGSTW